jgi:hypothetical protein
MKKKVFLLFLILGAVLIIGGLINRYKSSPLSNELQERLIKSSSFEALALNPVPVPDSDKLTTNVDMALRYPVLGYVKIDNQKTKQELVIAVSKDIAKANHAPTACILEPRHGIRCGEGANAVIMLICYRCGDVVLEQNGKTEDYLIKMGGGFRSPDSMKLFEKIFKEAGIETGSN